MDFKESLQNIKNKMETQKTISNDTNKRNNIKEVLSSNIKSKLSKPYNLSEKEALKQGFIEVEDFEAYNHRYFIKDGLIWIHNIEALKSKLKIYDEDKLRSMKYDVDTYYKQNNIPSNRKKNKRPRLYDTKDNLANCSFDTANMVYLSDGVYIHRDDCWF